MADIIASTDLPQDIQDNTDSAILTLWVEGANAKATRVAPCLDDSPTADQTAEAKLVLVGAVRRWAEAGSGAATQQTAGPFSVSTDTRQRSGYNLWPSEIEQLQALCADSDNAGNAFEIDTLPSSAGVYGVDYWWSGPDTKSTTW